MTSIAIFVFDGAEELDWAGPWEVLAAWAKQHPDDGVAVYTVAQHDGPVTCAKGLRVLPDYTWESAPPCTVLVYPGGQGTRAQIRDTEIRAWLLGMKERGVLLCSVCTGSLVFASAGLLDGRRATTHWSRVEMLGELGKGVVVCGEERFIDEGDVITAAGVSAGIDMSLHLISRLHSLERAKEVRRYIQYDPQPPV